MGCDIHSVAQVRKNRKWVTVLDDVAEDGRNYDTFSVYANVRNGYGFAGVSTGEGWKPISEPRGYPKDFTQEDDQHGESWMGDHSHSWLLLSEIQSAWDEHADADYTKHGVVERKHFLETLAAGKKPESWCGGIAGRDVVVTTAEAVQKGTAPLNYTHVECSWLTPGRDRLWLMRKQLDALRALREEHGVSADDVRLVFGFDS